MLNDKEYLNPDFCLKDWILQQQRNKADELIRLATLSVAEYKRKRGLK